MTTNATDIMSNARKFVKELPHATESLTTDVLHEAQKHLTRLDLLIEKWKEDYSIEDMANNPDHPYGETVSMKLAIAKHIK